MIHYTGVLHHGVEASVMEFWIEKKTESIRFRDISDRISRWKNNWEFLFCFSWLSQRC